jgi:hypothetical protein
MSNTNKKLTTVEIDKELHMKLKILSAQLGIPLKEVVEILIKKALAMLILFFAFNGEVSAQSKKDVLLMESEFFNLNTTVDHVESFVKRYPKYEEYLVPVFKGGVITGMPVVMLMLARKGKQPYHFENESNGDLRSRMVIKYYDSKRRTIEEVIVENYFVKSYKFSVVPRGTQNK